eukprot:c43432_g1_i1 orf=268-474(-)
MIVARNGKQEMQTVRDLKQEMASEGKKWPRQLLKIGSSFQAETTVPGSYDAYSEPKHHVSDIDAPRNS